MSAPTNLPLTDDYAFLIGRPPIAEYISFVRTMVVDGHSIDQGTLVQHWRDASARVTELEKNEAGAADGVPQLAITAETAPYADRVAADATFKSTFSNVPTHFAMVELDKLVVYQKFINLGFVNGLRTTMPPTPSQAEIAKLAFGLDRPLPNVTIRQAGPGVFQFVSPSSDIRLLEVTLVDPSKIADFQTSGIIQAFVAVSVGFGTNLLNAIQVEGRLVLHNGSHRAYLLRSLGVTHAPCVIQVASSRDELELIAPGDLHQNADRYLKVPRPSMLRDYFEPQLVRVFPVARKSRMVQVQVAAPISEIPGA